MPLRNRLPLIIGVVFGILTAFLVSAYIRNREVQLKRELLKGQEPIPVLVAARDIPANTTIQDGMVVMQNRPAYAIQPHAVMDPGVAIGMVVAAPIFEGEQVSDSKLTRPDSAGALSIKTPPGKRAITIDVNNITGVGGLVKPGDFVDILGTVALPSATGEKNLSTVTLLQRVLILAVGRQFSAAEGEGEAAASDNLTLALSPQDAQLILFARASGTQLQLSLRSRTDTAPLADLQPTNGDTLLGAVLGPKVLEMARQSAQPVIKAPDHMVEVYRGLQKEVVALPGETKQQ